MFCWIGCADGTSIDANKIEALGLNQVPIYQDKPDDKGQPIPQLDAEGKPMFQQYVVAVIHGNTYALRPVGGMKEAQLVIRSVLGNMKKEYNKGKPAVEIADQDDVGEIMKAKKVLLGG